MLSPKQWEVMCFGETSYDALICDGAVRSGKTSTECVAFVLWAMEHFNRCNFILAGVSVESCKRNVVSPMLATKYLNERYSMTWSSRANCLTVKTKDVANNFYVFGGKDEASYRIVQGLTAAGCLLDEVVLMPRSFVEQCMARCSVEGSKFWFSCNPGSPSHWFYREWVTQTKEKNAYRIHFKLTDNPSLSERTLERYERMYTGVFKQRYIDGDWVAAEGIVYPMWRDAIEERWEPSPEDPARGYCVSIDYGTQNPFAAIKWRRDKGGVWHAVDEYYHSGRESREQKTDQDYVEDMLAFCADSPDDVEVIVDPSAASFIAALRRSGGFRVRKADNDVLDGIRDVSVCLKSGLIRISDEMEHTKAEFEAYIWDDKSGKDSVVKDNDHCQDAIRYFVRTKRIGIRVDEYTSPFETQAKRRIR